MDEQRENRYTTACYAVNLLLLVGLTIACCWLAAVWLGWNAIWQQCLIGIAGFLVSHLLIEWYLSYVVNFMIERLFFRKTRDR